MTPNFPVNGIAWHYDDWTHDMVDQILVNVFHMASTSKLVCSCSSLPPMFYEHDKLQAPTKWALPVTSRVITPLTGVMTPIIHLEGHL